jgi:phosphopantetheinyl transferase
MNITTNSHSRETGPAPLASFFPVHLPLSDLTLHIRSQPQSCVALIDLNEVEVDQGPDNTLLKQVLSAAEHSYFKQFSYLKRRREWLGGRITAKAALLTVAEADLRLDSLPHLTILPDEYGRPIAETMQEPAISISHSNRFAVSLAVKGKSCGIDLQKTSSRLSSLTDRFAAGSELAILDRFPGPPDQATRLTMLWSTKEALKKSMLHDQPAIFSGIQLQRITVVRDHVYRFSCSVSGQPDQTAMVYNFFPYIIALTGADHA